jgi:hypothetical protein
MSMQTASHTPSEPTLHQVETQDGLSLPLKHFAAAKPERKGVLLLHGASASSATFEIPTWNGGSRGLVDYLGMQNFDVWTLDWRGGMVIAGDARFTRKQGGLHLDGAAKHDLPAAIAYIRGQQPEASLAIVGHCMGAAALAMAVGAGYVTTKDTRDLVLTSIGLFYDVPWDGWVKADDQALERSLIDDPQATFIHCDATRHPWPSSLDEAYKIWPTALLPNRAPEHPFSRLTFMFGRPFLEGVVGDGDQTAEVLRARFGAMPIALYIQAGQNVRRGFAAPYDDTGWSAARRTPIGRTGELDDESTGRYLHVESFAGMRVTLLTGALNALWHPDSIRRMHDWLRRDKKVQVSRAILPGYGHQDLYWGKTAPRDVYPRILRGITQT